MWVKLDDTLDDHPKFRGIDPRAGWLHVRGLIYCGRHLTDGMIAGHVARDLVAQVDPQQAMLQEEHPLLAQLVQRGIWERVKDGYCIHDFLDYNLSRRKVLSRRKQAVARRQKARPARIPASQVRPRTSHGRRANVAERSTAIDPARPGLSRPIPFPSLPERTTGDKDLSVAPLVDLFRAIPGITPGASDGGLIAGLVKRHGASHVEAVLRDADVSIGAARNPLQYLAGACRRPRLVKPTLEDDTAQTLRELAQFRAEGRLP